MQTILVVHAVDTWLARIWVCVTGVQEATPPAVSVRLSNGASRTVRSDAWRRIAGGTYCQIVLFTGLTPGKKMIASANGVQVKFSTLPVVLPRFGQQPLSVLLGSCYFKKRDRGVGALLRAIAAETQPDLKFLCGDQVYLDFPEFLIHSPVGSVGKEKMFLSKYLQNWGAEGGLGSVLKQGATWFSADDHEYWNNFPNATPLVAETWTANGRDWYRRAAMRLYDTFQKDSHSSEPYRVLRVDPLEFMVVDTRSYREQGDQKFLTSCALDTLTDWIDGLRGPGVLVVGQPLFVEPHTGFWGNIRKRVFDRNLADYQQYDRLAKSLISAPHSILVLTGDVHFPRLAQAIQFVDGRRSVFEVISSPSALVFGSHSETRRAPSHFPANPVGGQRLQIQTLEAPRRPGDNLATLEFTQVPGQVRVKLKYWYVQARPNEGPTMEFVLI